MYFSLASISIIIVSTLIAISSAGRIYELVDSTNDLDKRYIWEGHHHYGHEHVKREARDTHHLSANRGRRHVKRELCSGTHLEVNKRALCHGFKRTKRDAWNAHHHSAGEGHKLSRRHFHHPGGKEEKHVV
ncbi:hypothetical protein K501DRAFT_272653 [Backusella circina FSU 941]|nr:hypothetical protein K501DRAFT_272653 [Backusella circina FSU 941]